MSNQRYSAADVQRILALAMGSAEGNDETFSAESLAEMARDLEIGDGVLTQAVKSWQLEKAQVKKQAVVLLQKQQQRARFVRQEVVPYVVVNVFLIVLNVSLAGAITWAVYPLLGWGLALCLGVSSGNCGQRNSQARSSGPRGLCQSRNNSGDAMRHGGL